MRAPRKRSIEIRNYIVDNVIVHPRDITTHVSDVYDISREAVLEHIKKLIIDGILKSTGTTKDRKYFLVPLLDDTFKFDLATDTEEDKIWRHIIRPMLFDIPDNIMRICEYGLNEMINNAIEHSEGTKAEVYIKQNAAQIEFLLKDNGVGIFTKIMRERKLDELRQAILELSKGKLTTDPERHTGESIFFVSRMFDRFVVYSDGLFFSPNQINPRDIPGLWNNEDGTSVHMIISSRSGRTTQDVFNQYVAEMDDDFSFSKTDVPVSLANFGGDNLVSRSQARRLLNRLHEFRQITLDFTGIDSIGQAFADELFRVYVRNNPEIILTIINSNQVIDNMVRRVQSKK